MLKMKSLVDISLSEAIRAFADHIEIPYAPNVPHLVRSLLVIFEKSKLHNDRQVVLDMFNMIFRHYLKYNLYMTNHYDQESTKNFFKKVKTKSKSSSVVRSTVMNLMKTSKDDSNIHNNLSNAKKINRSHLFRMISNEHCSPTMIKTDDLIPDEDSFKFLISNEEDSNNETESESDSDDDPKQSKLNNSANKKSPNTGSNSKSKETPKKGAKGADKNRSLEDLQSKNLKRSYEIPFRDKFTLGEDSTKTTFVILEAFQLVRDYLIKFADCKDRDTSLQICEWSIETLSEMYHEASYSYKNLENFVSYEKWLNMFKVIRSCPYFEVIEDIFQQFCFSPLDPQDIGQLISKHSTLDENPRSWVVAYMNYCLWNQIYCDDFDMSLSNHFKILEQDCQDDSLSNRGFSKMKTFLQIMRYVSDEEPEMLIRSCVSNVPIFLNLLGTSRELINCYMSQLDVLSDTPLQIIFEYPSSEEVILRMFDILRFSQIGSHGVMLHDHIKALLDSVISICEDYNRCFTGILADKPSNCYRFIKNISPEFIASLIAYKDNEKNAELKMSFVRALCAGNIENLRCSFKAELLTLFLKRKVLNLKYSETLNDNEFDELFNTLTECFNSENLIDIIEQIFPSLSNIHNIESQQTATKYFVSLLIAKDFDKKNLYNIIVNNFPKLRKDPICIYHNLRLLDHWSELYFRSIFPDHKDYVLIYPTLMEAYFKVTENISLLNYNDDDYDKYEDLYPKILRLILNYFGRFTVYKHCINQITSCFVTSFFKNCLSIPNNASGHIQIGFLMELVKKITCNNDPELLRNCSDLFVKGLQTHFVSEKIGLYVIPQVENEIKLLEFFKENEFFMVLFEYFSKRQSLKWFHHVLKALLSASVSDLQSSRSMSNEYVNYGVAICEMFANGEYFSRSFLKLTAHMQDFKTFTRSEQATMLEEVLRVFARYGADIRLHWKSDFFRNHFSQCRLLISSKLINSDEVLAEIEQYAKD